VLLEKEQVMRISGWLSAVATISGIVFGVLTSLTAIAQFYSLAFIVVVLPFNLFYLFVNALHFPKREMYFFWIPIIVVSLMIWLSCYFTHENGKALSVFALFLLVAWHVKTELGQYVLNFFTKKPLVASVVEK